MKIIEKCVIDIATGAVLEEVSYEYDGPLALADFGGGSDLSGAYSAASAAETAALNAALDFQKSMWATEQQNVAPYLGLGEAAAQQQGSALGLSGYSGSDLSTQLQNWPGLSFLQGQGAKGIASQGAATGQYGSGAMGKGLANYSQNLAQTYALSPYLNLLSGSTTTGANAASGLNTQGTNTASNVSSLYSGIGSAQAQGILGSALANYNQNQSGMSNLYGGLGLLGGLAGSVFGSGGLGSLFGMGSSGGSSGGFSMSPYGAWN